MAYSEKFKKKVVKEYRNSGKSQKELCDEYDIGSPGTIKRWRDKYPEETDEPEENNISESDQDSDERDPEPEPESEDGKSDATGAEENGPEISDSSDESENGSDSGVVVDDVDPQEKDTRKNPDQGSQGGGSSEDNWVELDYNSGKQVKTILKTTDVSDPKSAQKLLKAFKTGNQDDIPEFDEIRLSDGELR